MDCLGLRFYYQWNILLVVESEHKFSYEIRKEAIWFLLDQHFWCEKFERIFWNNGCCFNLYFPIRCKMDILQIGSLITFTSKTTNKNYEDICVKSSVKMPNIVFHNLVNDKQSPFYTHRIWQMEVLQRSVVNRPTNTAAFYTNIVQ